MAMITWSKELGVRLQLSESEQGVIQERVAKYGQITGAGSEDQLLVAESFQKLDFGNLNSAQVDGLLEAYSQELGNAQILRLQGDREFGQEWLLKRALEELVCQEGQSADDWLAEEFGWEGEEDFQPEFVSDELMSADKKLENWHQTRSQYKDAGFGDFENRLAKPVKGRGSDCQLVVRVPVGKNDKGRLIFRREMRHGGSTPPLGRILNRENKCISHGHKPRIGSLECSEMHKVVYLTIKLVSGSKNSTGSSDAAGGTAYRQAVHLIGLSEHWTSLQCKQWPDVLQVDEVMEGDKKVPVLASFAEWCGWWSELQFFGRITGDESGELARAVGSIGQSPLCQHWSFVIWKNGQRRPNVAWKDEQQEIKEEWKQFIGIRPDPEKFVKEFERAFSGGLGRKWMPGLDVQYRLEDINRRWNRMVEERCCQIAGVPFDRSRALAYERAGKRLELANPEVMIHRNQAVRELLTGTVRGDRLQNSTQQARSATFSHVQKSGRGKDVKRRTPVDENGKSCKVNGSRLFTWPEGAVFAQVRVTVRAEERLAGLEELLAKGGVSFRYVERKDVCRDLRELEALKESRYIMEDVVDRKFASELFTALQFDFEAMLGKTLKDGLIEDHQRKLNPVFDEKYQELVRPARVGVVSGFNKVSEIGGQKMYADMHRDKSLMDRAFRAWMEKVTKLSVQGILAKLYGQAGNVWVKIPERYFPPEVVVEVRVPESRMESRMELAAMKLEEMGLPVTESTLGLALRNQREKLEFMVAMLAD